MPFPKLKYVHSARFFTPVTSHFEVTDKGKVIEVIDKTNGSMPPVEDFDLEKLIKAGVPLQKVNTTLFKSSLSDLIRVVDDIEKTASAAPVEPASVEPAPVEPKT